MRSKIPCFLRRERIKKVIENDPEITEDQVYQELLKDNTDTELHNMSEDEILNLILRAIITLRKKMEKEVKMIYI